MSDVLFPLSLITAEKPTWLDRVILDEFESGGSASRNMWGAQMYRRQIDVTMATLNANEYRYLRSFWLQRGTGDTFWYRQNLHRMGNVKARFAKSFPVSGGPSGFDGSFQLYEAGPIRSLPEWDEVATAAGATPLLWYDGNRERYFLNQGAVSTESSVNDGSNGTYPAPWIAGALQLGGITAQYQWFNFDGTNYAKTATTISEIAAGKPACTIFAICRHSTSAAQQMVFAIGGQGTNTGIGLQLTSANYYKPWIGSGETWSSNRFLNSTANTWRSVAVAWHGSSDVCDLYVNAALISPGADSNARSYAQGAAVLGNSPGATLIANPSNAMAEAKANHVLLFNTTLTLAQVKAVHNLLGYQYGLAPV